MKKQVSKYLDTTIKILSPLRIAGCSFSAAMSGGHVRISWSVSRPTLVRSPGGHERWEEHRGGVFVLSREPVTFP